MMESSNRSGLSEIESLTSNSIVYLQNSSISTKLKETNYLIWRQQVLATVKGYGLEGFLTGSVQPPQMWTEEKNGENTTTSLTSEYISWERQDQIVAAWLQSSLDESTMIFVVGLTSASSIWNALEAWSKYGKLPWKRLVAPAALLAMKGFEISPYLHMQMVSAESGIMADEGLRAVFTSNGSLLKPGGMCYNKELAKTLVKISRIGMKAFYNGSVGANLVKDVEKRGGILTMEDLQNYSVKMRKPLRKAVMGVDILGMPPPSSGGASMALILSILSWYEDLNEIPSSLLTHREIEALKHAFAVRSWLGDPDFADIRAPLGDMMSLNFSFDLQKTILDNTTFNSSHYGGSYGVHLFKQMTDHGTSHISIVDSQRNAVSMTTTINAYFGAKLMSKSTGIILNNEMDDFSIPATANANATPPPAPSNFIQPGKRPMSSMTPTIILDSGRIKAVVGASGGAMIIAGTTEVVINHFKRGMDPLAAVVAPRSYHQLIPNVLQYENWTVPTGGHFEVPKKTRNALAKTGHVLQSLAGGTICQFVVHELSKDSNVGPLVGLLCKHLQLMIEP